MGGLAPSEILIRQGNAGSICKSGSRAHMHVGRNRVWHGSVHARAPRLERGAELGPSSLRGSLPFPRANLTVRTRPGRRLLPMFWSPNRDPLDLIGLEMVGASATPWPSTWTTSVITATALVVRPPEGIAGSSYRESAFANLDNPHACSWSALRRAGGPCAFPSYERNCR